MDKSNSVNSVNFSRVYRLFNKNLRLSIIVSKNHLNNNLLKYLIEKFVSVKMFIFLLKMFDYHGDINRVISE